MHVEGGNLRGPAQTLVIAVRLSQGRHDAGDADAVGAHGHDLGLAILIEDGQAQGLGVLAAQLEDMADLDAALQVEGTRSVGGQVALAHLGGLDGAIGREVAAHDEVQDVALLGVRARDPCGALDDARIHQVAHRTGDVAFLINDAPRRVGSQHRGADVAAHQFGVRLEVRIRRHVDLGGSHGGLEALHIDVAVAGDAHDEQLAFTVRVGERHDDILQRVGGGPGAILTRVALVEQIHERLNRRSVGRGNLDGRGNTRRVNGLGDGGGHGLGVGGVATRGRHEGVLTNRRGVQELLRARAAHRTAHRGHDNVAQAQALEDALIGVALSLVGGVQSLVIDVERVGVLHDELTAADQAGARAGLVAVLRLNLVKGGGQVLVRGVHVLDEEREHLLVRGGQQVVAALTVVELEQRRAVLFPAVRCLVGVSGDQAREVHLLCTHRVHFLADDVLDLAQRTQAEGQPRVNAGGTAANVTGANQQLVGIDLGVSRVLTQSSQEESREISKHAPRVRHARV